MTPFRPLIFRLTAALLLGVSLIACTSGSDSDTSDSDTSDASSAMPASPFQVSLQPVAEMEVGLHSFALGETEDGRWVVIGGRVDGFHGFSGPGQDFPNTTANRSIRVLNLADTSSGGVLSGRSMEVLNLPDQNLHTLLTATNYQHAQVGGTLYLTGGYGQKTLEGINSSDSEFSTVTHRFLATVDVGALADAVEAGNRQDAQDAIQYTMDYPATAMTGGELMPVSTPNGPMFYQVFGHQFNGTYSSFGGCDAFVPCDTTASEQPTPANCVPSQDDLPLNQRSPITSFAQFEYYADFDDGADCASKQLYAREIRRFRVGTASDGSPTLDDYRAFTDTTGFVLTDPTTLDSTLSEGAKADINDRFRRRDLPVTPMMNTSGDQGFTAWGGVFRPEKVHDGIQMWGAWNDAVHFVRDTDGNEGYTIGSDSEIKSSVYATAHAVFHDSSSGGDRLYTTLIGGINDGEEWTNRVTTLVQDFQSDETTVTMQADSLAQPMGSEGEFIPHDDLLVEAGKPFIDYASLPSGTTSIGFMLGSITTATRTAAPSGTESSRIIYEVFIEKP